jgi:stearoyl-CoA desaturase (delta-9 desaturase)
VAIAIFLAVHWQASVFFQSFFHHRYGAHRQFTMTKAWERFFHLVSYLVQGSSYLSPRAYAIMHRMHHAYSDTPKDPHSPTNFRGLYAMMNATRIRYTRLKNRSEAVDPRFEGGYPEWRLIDHYGASWPASIAWGALYLLFYMRFATAPWMYALLPIHWIMGPIHGAIVNWCGHRYGYRNFASDDVSRNTLVFDVLTMGELFQNNHHKYAMSPNFAARWFEIDPSYQLMKVLHWLGAIDMSNSQVMRWEPAVTAAPTKAAPSRPAVAAPVLPPASAAVGE